MIYGPNHPLRAVLSEINTYFDSTIIEMDEGEPLDLVDVVSRLAGYTHALSIAVGSLMDEVDRLSG